MGKEHAKFVNLDAIRGIAAILVVLIHAPLNFGAPAFEQSYIAVDLFFAMSGLVIANAYEHKLITAKLDFWSFMRLRIVRLYPLYLVGALLGIAAYLLKEKYVVCSQLAVSNNFALAAGLSIFMIPSIVTVRLYPFDAPAWSLLFEIIANGLYAKFFRNLSNKKLMMIMAISGIGILAKLFHSNTIDAGFHWSHFHWGLARVLFSFSAGVLIYRKFQGSRGVSGLRSILVIFLVIIMLCSNYSGHLRGIVTAVTILIAIPCLVYLAAYFEPPEIFRSIFKWMGAVSYGIYVIHVPLLSIAEYLLFNGLRLKFNFPFIFIAIPVLLLIVHFLDRYFDLPVRRYLLSNIRVRPKSTMRIDMV